MYQIQTLHLKRRNLNQRNQKSLSKGTLAKHSNDKDSETIDSEQIENIVRARDELFRLHKSQKIKLPFDVDTFLKQKGVDIQSIFEGEKSRIMCIIKK